MLDKFANWFRFRFPLFYLGWNGIRIHCTSCRTYWNKIPRHTPFMDGGKVRRLIAFSFVRQENLFIIFFGFFQVLFGVLLGLTSLSVFGLLLLCLSFWSNFYNAVKNEEQMLVKTKALWTNIRNSHKEPLERGLASAVLRELDNLYPNFKQGEDAK